MDPAIRIQNLGKTYRSGFLRIPFVGLREVNLDVPQGAAFGFVGPNGAGKTTTIKILMGLQAPTSGSAWIHGVPISDFRSRKSVGFLPERPYFYEHLTAYEFLDFYGRLAEVPSSDRRGRITTLLERVDLARFRDVALGKFSKGMLQRAGLAQALIGEPKLVVLDEPMSGLDPLGRVLVRDLILEERRNGRTVFFSSHILSDVEAICDRVAIIVSGALRGHGTVAELLVETTHIVEVAVRVTTPLRWAVHRVEGEITHLRVTPEAVDEVLDAVRAGGGRVVSVVPVQKTLEQVLLDEVERARPIDAARLGVLA